MPIYTLEGPDGKRYTIEGPAGASADDLERAVKDYSPPATDGPSLKDTITDAASRYWEGFKGGANRARVGINEALEGANAAIGAKDYLPPEVQASRRADRAQQDVDLADYNVRKPQLGTAGAIGDLSPELLATAVPIAKTGSLLARGAPLLGRLAPAAGDIAANTLYETGKAVATGDDPATAALHGAGGAIAGRTVGRAVGAAGGAARNAFGDISEATLRQLSPEAQALVRRGIIPTPGQAFGGVAQRVEDVAKHVPGAGGAVANAQARAGRQYAGAELQDAMSGLGVRIDGEGLKAVQRAEKVIGDSYDDLATRTFMTPDAARTAALRAGADMHKLSGITPQQIDHVVDFIDKTIKPLTHQGTISGRAARDVDIQIGEMARRFESSADPMAASLGDAYRTLQKHWRDVLSATDKTAHAQLQATNQAFKNMIPVAKAANQAGNKKGMFTPDQFRRASQGGGALDISGGPLNDAAMSVIGPASGGTLARNVIGGSLGATLEPHTLAALAGGAAGARALYSERGVKMMLGAMAMPASRRAWVESLPPAKQQEFLIRMLKETPELRQLAAQVGSRLPQEETQ